MANSYLESLQEGRLEWDRWSPLLEEMKKRVAKNMTEGTSPLVEVHADLLHFLIGEAESHRAYLYS